MICQVTCVHCRACNCQRIHWVAPDGALVSQEACDCAACSLGAVTLVWICRHMERQSALDSCVSLPHACAACQSLAGEFANGIKEDASRA